PQPADATVSPDGRTVASAGWGSVLLWDLARGGSPTAFGWVPERPAYYESVVFSRDGRTLAAGSGNAIRVWDVAGRKLLHRLDGLRGSVYSVALFPDGKRLAA